MLPIVALQLHGHQVSAAAEIGRVFEQALGRAAEDEVG